MNLENYLSYICIYGKEIVISIANEAYTDDETAKKLNFKPIEYKMILKNAGAVKSRLDNNLAFKNSEQALNAINAIKMIKQIEKNKK